MIRMSLQIHKKGETLKMVPATATTTNLGKPMIRTSSPEPPMIGLSFFGQAAGMKAIDRFFDKVTVWPNGCWLWCGAINQSIHGAFYYEGKNHPAHRWIYEYFFGPSSSELDHHHTCDNPWCVNPYHVKPLTKKEHTATKFNFHANQTHCKNGHPFSGDNLRIYMDRKTKKPIRRCIKCKSNSNSRRTYGVGGK